MTLILSNDDLESLLPIRDCLERLEEMYSDLGHREAVNRPRSDLYALPADEGRYVFKSMDGLTPRYEVAALRLNSDVIRWSALPSGIRKDKQPLAAGGKWVGLILLFSTRTGEPIAIMPDGVIQRLRVASANAIAAKYMAPVEASVYALMGAGWQASGQAMAMAAVRKLREIRIYSPTRENRERLAASLRSELGISVQAFDNPRDAVRTADIVGMATNSVTPVVEMEWLSAHAHVTCVKELELGDGILERSAQVVVHARTGSPANYFVGSGGEPHYAHDPQEALSGELNEKRGARRASTVDLTKQPDLGEVVTGQVSPSPPGQLSCFVNNIGLGTQFAALGALAHDRARKTGLGHEIPTDWFLESVHP